MNTETGEIRRLQEGEQLRAGEKPVPKRFRNDAETMLARGRVPSVAFAMYAGSGRARAAKKRRQKIADASRRRNRR